MDEFTNGGAPAITADRLNEPFHLKTAVYDAPNNRITLTFGRGRARFYDTVVSKTVDFTYYINTPVINTTYYLYIKSDGSITHNVTGTAPADSMPIWKVATGASVATITKTDIRPLLEATGYAHSMRTDNPHLVTAAQVGALPTSSSSLFSKRVNLFDQVQVSDYRRSVIALCEVTNTSPDFNSYSIGMITFHRINGLSGSTLCQLAIEKKYNTTKINFSGFVMGFNGLEIRPCTFTYGGIKYGGIEFYLSAAEMDYVSFHGESNFAIFGVDYYDEEFDTVVNAEVNGSLNFDTDINWIASIYFNRYKIWHEGNDGSGSGLDADKFDGLESTDFVKKDGSVIMTGALQMIDANRKMYRPGTSDLLALENVAGSLVLAAKSNNYVCGNAYYNGTAWQRHDTTKPAVKIVADGANFGKIVVYTVGAGANPIAWSGPYEVWHSGNDGSGSGLDADLLDGRQPSTAATAYLIMQRDSAGRSKVADPSAADDIATMGYVDGGIVSGSFTGNDANDRVISVGFTPKIVIIRSGNSFQNLYIAWGGVSYVDYNSSGYATWGDISTGFTITSGGFIVDHMVGSYFELNKSTDTYTWTALR
jgi:hypothetical protein